ncbi:MAG TPA: glycosyltransferase family 4 protein, partial [Phenylobacterium sp.]|nr:glycosyltransferase family 4 protein [Phenylobacterium sp.]
MDASPCWAEAAHGPAGPAATEPRARSSLRLPDDRPHLVHVFPTFGIGGAQVRFAALAEGLGERFRHTVLSLDGDYDAAALIPSTAPVRYAVPPAPARSLAARIGRYRAALAALSPDILVTYNWGSMEVVLANGLAGFPHLHQEDGFGPDEAARQLPRRIWARRIALARSRVIVPSHTLQNVATRTWRLDRRRVQLIPNGVSPGPERPSALHSLGLDLPPGLPVI